MKPRWWACLWFRMHFGEAVADKDQDPASWELQVKSAVLDLSRIAARYQKAVGRKAIRLNRRFFGAYELFATCGFPMKDVTGLLDGSVTPEDFTRSLINDES